MKSAATFRLAEETAPEEVPSPSEIADHLQQIMTSHPFRTSRQCKELLGYLVQHSQREEDGALRERVIGMHVFGRDPTYDTNEDPVVRIRAADVRKRLAQFYQSLGPSGTALHLDLLPGSYRVHFRQTGQTLPAQNVAETIDAMPPPEELAVASVPIQITGTSATANIALSGVPNRRLAGPRWIWPAALGLSVLAMSALLINRARVSPQQRFWAPLTETKQPVLVYLGSNMAYIFSPEFLARYRSSHDLPNNGPEFPVDLSIVKSVETKDLVPVQDTFVTTADLSAAVALTAQLRDWKKPFVLRAANDLSIGDLRNRPTLLVGGFNNPWTLQMTKALPFSFREGTTIQESDGQRRSWSVDPHARASTQEDYALIIRLLHSATGGPSLAVAGIGQYGTQASAELLADSDALRGLLQNAPKGWETKNLEIVLRVKVLQFQPVSTEIIAEKAW